MGQLLAKEHERPLVILTGLLDGCASGSKSAMLHKASNDQVIRETPHVGMDFEVAVLHAHGIDLTVHCFDYGGCDKVASQRRDQLKRAAAIMLVVSPHEVDPAYRAFYHRKQAVPPFSEQGLATWPVYAHQVLPHIFLLAESRKPVLVLMRTNAGAAGDKADKDADLGKVVAGLQLGPAWGDGARDTETSGSLGPGAPWRVQAYNVATGEGFQEGLEWVAMTLSRDSDQRL